ncbi:MAG: amidophosphoribosyltransferase [Clostridiales bacterium]|nr:amidophosphoribosyltransferase [Clostridiales bacterium]
MLGEIHEECGVFGIYNNDEINCAHETYLSLYALQHRGQASCGIAVNNSRIIDCYKNTGIVPEVLTQNVIKELSDKGNAKMALGHVRYSNSKEEVNSFNSQPFVMSYSNGSLSIVNNGSLVNTRKVCEELENKGAVFQTSSDAELIAYIVARERLKTDSIEKAVSSAMEKIEGAYSFLMMTPSKLVAVRDPYGFRPLCIGKLKNSYVFSSESCVFDTIGAEFVRDVEPGEIVFVNEKGLNSIKEHCGKKHSLCIFEHVYFARQDSVIDGVSVHAARQAAGRYLAQQKPVEADVVIGVPDAGIDAAVGYASQSGIPYELGFIKNRYIGRTLIQDKQSIREKSVRIKLNPIASVVKDKKVVLVDDSIVRGTTIGVIVSLLRKAGAKEVHLRISSPAFLNPCYFGTNVKSKECLIACRYDNNIEELCKYIGADSLEYLSVENLKRIAKNSKCEFCDACFTGNYPIEVEADKKDKFSQRIDEYNLTGQIKLEESF